MSNAAKFEVPDSGDNGKAYVYSSGSDAHVLTDVATQAELDAHEADTTSVHGIADTSTLVTTSTSLGGDLTGTVGNAQIAAGAVGATELATDAVTNAKVADDAIGVAELSATGTPSSSTYLRGDNTWATVSTSADTGAAPNALTGSPTLLAWYKADALALSDGDAVATWTDSGSNGYNLTQATSGSRPIYRAQSGLNDQPAILFDGVDDFVRNSSTGASSQTNLTIAVVGVATSNANMRALDLRGTNYVDLSQGGSQISWQVGPPVSLFVTTKYNSPLNLFIMRSNGTKAQAYVNGVLHSFVDTGSGAVTPTQIAVGNDNGTGQYWKGLIAEVVIYGAFLTQAQMRQVSRHLANKYGLPLGVITA